MRTKKDFDCVKMMREIRDKISADIMDKDNSQILEYFRQKSKEFKRKYAVRASPEITSG